MLTGIVSCSTGNTSAPPFITTFSPPSPVRMNARSFDERRYSQCSSQTNDRDDDRDDDQAQDERSELGTGHDDFLRLLYRLMALNLRVVSVSATSVGRRSMLEAP